MGTFKRLAKSGLTEVTSLIKFDGVTAKHLKPNQGYAKYVELTLADMISVNETHVKLPDIWTTGTGVEKGDITLALQFNPYILPSLLLIETKANEVIDIPNSLSKFKRERLEGYDYIVRIYYLEN
jgi:hypothetical protein